MPRAWKQVRLDRPHRRAEDAGHLLVGEVVIDLQDHGAPAFGELRHGLPHPLRALGPLQLLRRDRPLSASASGSSSDGACARPGSSGTCSRRSGTARSRTRYPRETCRSRGTRAGTLPGHVVGILVVVHVTGSRAGRLPLVAGHQAVEGFPLSALGRLDGLAVASRKPRVFAAVPRPRTGPRARRGMPGHLVPPKSLCHRTLAIGTAPRATYLLSIDHLPAGTVEPPRGVSPSARTRRRQGVAPRTGRRAA